MAKKKKFDGTEGKKIALKKAAGWTKRYRDKNPGEVKAIFFGCDKLQYILDENGCKGIRIYFGIDEDGKKRLVLAGADADMNNLLPTVDGKGGEEGPMLLDDGIGCPDYCPSGSDPLGG